MKRALDGSRPQMISLLVTAGLYAALSGAALAQTAPPFVATQDPGQTNIGDWVGAVVMNDSAEVVGNVNYLLADASGQIKTVAIGVGGFLGLGEKNVAVPFRALSLTANANGERQFRISVTRAELEAAPKFEWRQLPLTVRIEENVKSAAEKVSETAKDLGKKASDAISK